MTRICRILMILALAGLSMSLAGLACVSEDDRMGDEPEQFVTLTLTEADTGKAVQLDTGQKLNVRLAANPTTGFGWTVKTSGDCLEPTPGDPVFEPSSSGSTAPIGAGGTDVWTYTAIAPGSQTLTFEYSRPWESVPPAKTITFTVGVETI